MFAGALMQLDFLNAIEKSPLEVHCTSHLPGGIVSTTLFKINQIELITSFTLLCGLELEKYQQKCFMPIGIVCIGIIHTWPSLPIGVVYWIPVVVRA